MGGLQFLLHRYRTPLKIDYNRAISEKPSARATLDWVQGAPLHLHTQLHTQVLGRLCGWRVRIALYNRLFAWSIVTRCRDVGGKIPPWGNGLKGLKHELFKLYFFMN